MTITAQKAADNDYNGASATLELTIGKKALTVRAESYQIYVGDAQPAVLGYTVDGHAPALAGGPVHAPPQAQDGLIK